MPTLLLTTTEGSELRFELTDNVHLLGRLGENDLHVPDASVSSRHAEFHRQKDGSYELVDLQSTNGTKVNGESIERTVLTGGESILFGQVEGVYTGDVEARSSAAAEESTEPSGGGGSNNVASLEAAAAQGEITTSSARPQDFDSSSPFGPKKGRRDPVASLAMGVGIFSLFMCLVVAFLVLQMRA